jgi:hypothetical protein
MNPYPIYYCPPGVNRPTHCAFTAGMRMNANASPDGQEGLLYAPDSNFPKGLAWQQSTAGWFVMLGHHRPQDLIRLDTSPRIVQWYELIGAQTNHAWRVPILLSPTDAKDAQPTYISALDRVLHEGGWSAPEGLFDIQRRLLCVALGVALDDDLAKRTQAMVALAVDILSHGHHVSAFEVERQGWLSEQLIADVILVAMGRADLLAKAPADAV